MMQDGNEWEVVSPSDFAKWFNTSDESFSGNLLSLFGKFDLRFKAATKEDVEVHLLDYVSRLQSPWIERNREENRKAWEKGWSENLEEVIRCGPSGMTCRPKYFRGSRFLRLRKNIVISPNPQLEHDLLTITRVYLAEKYLASLGYLCELGCGSGQNLWLLSEIFPDKSILGLDWVPPCVGIAQEIGKAGRKVSGRLFDMTDPDPNVTLPRDAGIVSVHALEQIGGNHEKLIQWIISQKPAIVVQHEPIVELYDSSNLYDALAIWYSKKRHYLDGYLNRLKELALVGKIEMLESHRPEVGGVYHEASVVVWRPVF